jgi:hypothetical protein
MALYRRSRTTEEVDPDPVIAWVQDSRPLTWLERLKVGIKLWRNNASRLPLPVAQTNPKRWITNKEEPF